MSPGRSVATVPTGRPVSPPPWAGSRWSPAGGSRPLPSEFRLRTIPRFGPIVSHRAVSHRVFSNQAVAPQLAGGPVRVLDQQRIVDRRPVTQSLFGVTVVSVADVAQGDQGVAPEVARIATRDVPTAVGIE